MRKRYFGSKRAYGRSNETTSATFRLLSQNPADPPILWLWYWIGPLRILQFRSSIDELESYKCANDISDRKGHMADRMRPLPLPSDCYLEIPLTDRWYYDCERGNSSCRCCLKITFLLHGSNGDTQYRYPENIQGPMTKSARLLQSRWPTPMSVERCSLLKRINKGTDHADTYR